MPATGLNGDVTFASGYTTIVSSWVTSIFASPQDKTGFQPVDDHQVLCATDLLYGAEGRYTAKICVTADADITDTGDIYNSYPYQWVFMSQCEPQMETAFGDTWHTWAPGLITSQFRMQSWIDETEPLPTTPSGTATLVAEDNGVDPNAEYVVPYAATRVETSVSVEGDQREIMIEGAATAAPTVSLLPMPGVTGTATFTAMTGREYTCSILVTGVECRVNRPALDGMIAIDFVVDGELTGA